MAMSMTLGDYLADQRVDYHLLKHKHTTNSFDTAYTAHIPLEKLAKAVVLEDDRGERLMAVVPSMNRLRLHWINRRFNRNFHLVGEADLKQIFSDCDLGAIPAVGQAYRMPTICDDQLLEEPYVYIEAGDHEELVKIGRDQFCRLMAAEPHDHISVNRSLDPVHLSDPA